MLVGTRSTTYFRYVYIILPRKFKRPPPPLSPRRYLAFTATLTNPRFPKTPSLARKAPNIATSKLQGVNNPLDTTMTTVGTRIHLLNEEDRAQGSPAVSPDARRMRWSLNGPLETAITVARAHSFDPDEDPEPYYQGLRDGLPIWHPISQSSISNRKISSLRIHVNPLDMWDYFWMEKHEMHTDPAGTYDPAVVRYGPFADDDEDEKSDGEEHLLVCCWEKRPRGKGTHVLVKATDEFVTIHDFLSVVHPYLMARRDEIIEAMSNDPGRMNGPFVSETKLMVTLSSPASVNVKDEAEWLFWAKAFSRVP